MVYSVKEISLIVKFWRIVNHPFYSIHQFNLVLRVIRERILGTRLTPTLSDIFIFTFSTSKFISDINGRVLPNGFIK